MPYRRNTNHLWEVLMYARRIFHKVETKDPLNQEAASLSVTHYLTVHTYIVYHIIQVSLAIKALFAQTFTINVSMSYFQCSIQYA